jgi:hypothetical protein
MARRFRSPYNGKRYLVNTNTNQIHDLDKEDTDENACQIDEIKHEHIKMYDYHFEATKDGFVDCDYCLK